MSIRGLQNEIIVDFLKIFCYNIMGEYIYIYTAEKLDYLKIICYNISVKQ